MFTQNAWLTRTSVVALAALGAGGALASACVPRNDEPDVPSSVGAPPPAAPMATTATESEHGPEPGPGKALGAPDDTGSETPDPDAPAPAPESAPPPPPPKVSFGKPKFTSGDVPDVVKELDKQREPIARCIAEHGGLSAPRGSVKIQFLVRFRGKAEGVGINGAEHVEDAATKCIQSHLKDRWVGNPSEDPVGVTITIELEEASPR